MDDGWVFDSQIPDPPNHVGRLKSLPDEHKASDDVSDAPARSSLMAEDNPCVLDAEAASLNMYPGDAIEDDPAFGKAVGKLVLVDDTAGEQPHFRCGRHVNAAAAKPSATACEQFSSRWNRLVRGIGLP